MHKGQLVHDDSLDSSLEGRQSKTRHNTFRQLIPKFRPKMKEASLTERKATKRDVERVLNRKECEK